MTLVLNSVLKRSFIYDAKVTRKLLTTKSHDSAVPMSVQCNVISLISRNQDIIKFVIVRRRKMKILKKKYSRFVVSNSQGTQITETATCRCFTEMVV